MSRDNLDRALREHIERAPFDPGRVHHIEIRHADQCPVWDGHDCDCEPSILSGAPINRRYDR